MFKKLGFENMLKSKSATGIEIVLLPDNAYEINLVVLKRNKSDVVTTTKTVGVTDFVSLSTLVDRKSPVILVINGKGIIHRKMAVSENDSLLALLNKVLPNANINDFYIQKKEINASQNFISVVRASVVNQLFEELKKNEISNIVECFIGPFEVNAVLPIIDRKNISNEYLTVGNHKLLIREDVIQEVMLLDNSIFGSIDVGTEVLDEKLLIPFAAALSYFVGTNTGLVNSELIDAIKDNFKQKQKFEFLGWTVLVATFVILMVNYFVFDHYWKKNNEMNATLVLNQTALKKYETLKTEYTQKKDFLEQNGLLENSRTSYYADQLAASLPMSIQLLEMNIHPLKKKEVDDLTNAFYFKTKTIKVSGKCNRNTELNDWMKKIKENNWIEQVSLLNYKQDNAKDDGLFFLEIRIK